MYKKPQFRFFVVLSAFLAVFLVLGPIAQAKGNAEGRYFIASKNSLLKSLFGVQHEFKNGFTSDLTSGEVWTLEKIFKVGVSGVPLYKTNSAGETASANVLNDVIGGLALSRPKQRDSTPDSPVAWGVKKIYNEDILKSTSGGKGVDVAVLDTGADVKHLDLADQIKDCKDFTRGPIPRSACEDKNGHGTHVAGIIAADGGFDGNGLWGVASEANLFIYKVCRNDGTCWADDVAAGLAYAKDNGINVANVSLGGPSESSLLKDIIDEDVKANVLIVAAAGNDGPDKGTINWPAAYSEVVAVGALTPEDIVPDWASRGVNDGDYIIKAREMELAAPGVNIQSTWNDGAYRYLSGTSMAAAHVSGLAAKIWTGSATSTRSNLQNIAKDIWSSGDDAATGFGLPQIYKGEVGN